MIVLLGCLTIVLVALVVLAVLGLRLLRRAAGVQRDLAEVQAGAARLHGTVAHAQTVAERAQQALARRA